MDICENGIKHASWEEAFELAGRHLRKLENPNQAAFYTSGRLSNEATFLYQLLARELGTNNLRQFFFGRVGRRRPAGRAIAAGNRAVA